MLRKEQNELLTQTGPGTAMGRLFRSYWLPALLAEQLPENDCPPVRVKLLSERLLAFRDSEGRYGLIDEFCAHRGVSLWFGRNEEGGLRCPYHGWKYDTTGQCVDVPSEPAESGYCRKIKLTSYPLVKRGDVLWLVVRESLLLVAIGIALGLPATWGAARFISSILYGLTAHDPATMTGAAILVLAIAALAAYLPARRATKVDPMVALRYE